VRHGQKDKSQGDDPGLTDKGKEQVRRMAAFLKDKKLSPSAAVRTDTERTKQTMEIVLKELGVQCPVVVREHGFGNKKNKDQIKADVAAWAADTKVKVDTLVFVGHNAQQSALVGKFDLDKIPRDARAVLAFEIDPKGEWAEVHRYVEE